MLLEITTMAPDDYVGFTFFIGYMAMAAAAVFFFVERGSVDAKWKMSVLVSSINFIPIKKFKNTCRCCRNKRRKI